MIIPKIQVVHSLPQDPNTIRVQESLMRRLSLISSGIYDEERRVGGVASYDNSLLERALWLSPKYKWNMGTLPNDEYIYLVPTLK